jgi:hypothetical protein
VGLPTPERTKMQGGHGRFCQLLGVILNVEVWFDFRAQGGYYSGHSNLFRVPLKIGFGHELTL